MGRMFRSQPVPFTAQVETLVDTASVRLSGELDIARLPELRFAMQDARASGCSRIVLDLRGLEFIDSIGVTELLRIAHQERIDGRAVEYLCTPGAVTRTLDLMRVTTLLPLAA